jgi:type III secretion protein K
LTQSSVDHALRMARALTQFNLHPEVDLHPSWLPPAWPAPHRAPARFGPAARALLGDWVRRSLHAPAGYDTHFESANKRLALLDARSLRLLAVYCGLAVHRPLFKQRGVGTELRRQARRFDAAAFAQDRMPDLPAFAMNPRAIEQRPRSAGRVIVRRGSRLLMALLAGEGEPVLRRTRLKLPRAAAQVELPVLNAAQRQQLAELIHLCIVPERLSPWDWLF